MTKRMLSLLLALVMTLSLCVPALAADEFAAEAVTEVEEQAPEAPVEPEAPEAEEPVEEPVVDEPAEEADAPEIAAIMEEEDLPLLVKLGVVSKDAHWDLYKAVTGADEIMADVKAGVYRQGDVDEITETDIEAYIAEPTEENDPFKKATAGFLEAYEKAAEMLAAVDGKEVDYDVTTTSVEDAATALAKYLPDSGKDEAMVDTVDTTNMTRESLTGLLEGAIATYDEDGDGKNDADPALDVTSDKLADVDVTKGDWPDAYQAGYLKELQSAIDTVLSYTEGEDDGTAAAYADYTAVLKQVISVLQAEFEGARPAASDMSALTSAISKAESAATKYNKDKYVVGLDSLSGVIGQANALLSDTQGLNGFATDATYYAYNKAITDINNALVTKTNSIRYEAHTADMTDNKVDVIVSVVAVDNVLGGDTLTGDGNVYGYSYKVGDYYFTGEKAGSKNASEATITKIESFGDSTSYAGRLATKLENLYNVLGEDKDGKSGCGPFAKNAKITIYFHLAKDSEGKEFYRSSVASKTFTVDQAGYTGPTIKSATFSANDENAKFSYTTGDLTKGTTVTFNDSSEAKVEVTLTKPMGEVGNDKDILAYSVYVKNGSNVAVASVLDAFKEKETADLTTSDDVYFVAGDMTVKLDADMTSESTDKLIPKNMITRSSATVEVEPLSKWSQVYQVKKVIKDAGKLVKSDYKFKAADDGDRVDVRTVDQVFQVVNNGSSKLNSLITGAKTANTDANRNLVVNTINDMINACKHLDPKAADTSALDKLILEASAIIDEGEDPWTFDTWGKLNDAFDDATADGVENGLQSEVDALVKELQDAIKGMTKEGEVDKTALTAAIAEAKALNEADYTPESWATAKPAIDEAVTAAEAVLANENATQAQVNTAVNAIKAAIATLEAVKPEGPVAPASGTGWVLYEGTWYFFKGGKLVSNYWVGKIDGASKWDNNWYYVGSDGKMATGMQYIDDLHGGYGWYFLQPTNANGEIGKMLTGWQWVGGQYGTCYFSAKNGEAGKCTYSTELGNWNGTGWVK